MENKVLPLLQMQVLQCLNDGPLTGKQLRSRLPQLASRTLPAFYQLMGRVEAADLIRSYVDETDTSDRPLRRKLYEITPNGRRSCNLSQDWYAAKTSEVSDKLAIDGSGA